MEEGASGQEPSSSPPPAHAEVRSTSPRTVGGFSANYWIAISAVATISWLTTVYWLSGGYSRLMTLAEKPNELGDFLAGAFAPVAFGWLVVAVVLQAQELRAQREELIQTVIELGKQSSWMERTFSISKEIKDAAELQQSIELLARQITIMAPDSQLAILKPFDLAKGYDHEVAAELAFDEHLEEAEKVQIFGDSVYLRNLVAAGEYDATIRVAVTSLDKAIERARASRNKMWLLLQNEIEVQMLTETVDHINKLSPNKDNVMIARSFLSGLWLLKGKLEELTSLTCHVSFHGSDKVAYIDVQPPEVSSRRVGGVSGSQS